MKAQDFVNKLKYVTTLKTTYLMGGFGCRLGKDWYNENYQWNKEHAAELKAKYNSDPITYGFDCVCYLKSILFWQFQGDPSKEFGGSKYSEKTDLTIQAMLDSCPDLTDDWSKIDAGEFVWMEGHIGAYLGDGLVAEATPSWNSGAQISALGNIGQVKGYPTRTWTKHGHSNYVTFETSEKDQYAATLAALKAMVEKNGVLQEELNKTKADLTTAQNALKTHKDAIAEMDEELHQMQKKLEEAQSSAEKEREEKEKAIREKEEEVGAIQSELTDLIESHKRELEVISDQMDRLTEEISTKDKTIESLKHLKGDINGDGQVNLADVFTLLLQILRKGN